MESKPYLKGRGAQINPASPFDKFIYDKDPHHHLEDEDTQLPTQFIDVHPKTIVNKVKSKDIPFDYSMNPYQGCEHGCIYCYARNTHPYWGYSAGLEFEQKILIKKTAPKLLEEKFRSKNWVAAPIMLSGNTDCYQPIEKKLEITRGILEVCWKYRHPVGILTKNSLVLRDLDILKKLAAHNLVKVGISITTLREDLRQFMEPRTATVAARLKTINLLAEAGIPVNAMIAPIIPGLNDNEIFQLVKAVADNGANTAGYSIVRLDGDVKEIFEDWLKRTYPDRADRVMNQIKNCFGGEIPEQAFRNRRTGQGNYAEIIHKQFKLAVSKFLGDHKRPKLNVELYHQLKNPQMNLFD